MEKQPNRVRELRKMRGLTQTELATLVGTSQSHIANIEKGLRDIDINLLIRLTRALRVKAYEILPEEEQPEILSEEEKAILALFRKSKANNNPPTPAKAE